MPSKKMIETIENANKGNDNNEEEEKVRRENQPFIASVNVEL